MIGQSVHEVLLNKFLTLYGRAPELVAYAPLADNLSQGMLQTASNDRTSATRVVPNAVQEGDAATMLLWATPYGQEVEALFEQVRPFAVVIG